ncbi:SDR family oxidoreductase [Rubrivirga sp.]|uniref:SDR family oxidoreductase n=1 Tax=Rubrivirga sp. TaxID=1885344 RepID=UPI003B521C6B
MSERVLILGATSAIAHAVARRVARRGGRLALAARDADKLAANAADLRALGASEVVEVAFDAADFDRHGTVVAQAWDALGGLDVALVAYGTLPDADEVATDPEAAVRAFRLNATSVISVVTHLASRFEAQGDGVIAVLSSVAGDRGRASNYVYGAAKGAVSLFTGGLRGRLAARGVAVVTVKPGFVDTPMTADVSKNALFADPDHVAQIVDRAIQRRADVVYAPGWWRPVMAGVRAVPERLFKRLPL